MTHIIPPGQQGPNIFPLENQHEEVPKVISYRPLGRIMRAVAFIFILPIGLCGGSVFVRKQWKIIRDGSFPIEVARVANQYLVDDRSVSGVETLSEEDYDYDSDEDNRIEHAQDSEIPVPTYSQFGAYDGINSVEVVHPLLEQEVPLNVLFSTTRLRHASESKACILRFMDNEYKVYCEAELPTGYCLKIQNIEDLLSIVELKLDSAGVLVSIQINGQYIDISTYTDSENRVNRLVAGLSKELVISPHHLEILDGILNVHPLAISKHPGLVLKKIAEFDFDFTGVSYLKDDLVPAVGIDGGGLSQQFITELVSALLNQGIIHLNDSGMPILEDLTSEETKELYVSFGKLIEYSAASGFTIGCVLPDAFFGLLVEVALNPAETVSDLCLKAAKLKLDQESNPESALRLKGLITFVEEGSISEGCREFIESFGEEATRDAAKVLLVTLFSSSVNATKAIYSGFKDEFKGDVCRSSLKGICDLIQGSPITLQGVIRSIRPGSGLNSVVNEKIEFLKELISEKFRAGEISWIKKFLFCVTGQTSLKASSRITILPTTAQFCMAHTCFSQLEIPITHVGFEGEVLETREGRKKSFLKNLELTMAFTGYTDE